MTAGHAPDAQPRRTIENAPPEVRAVGGVTLSLWLTGANETDTLIVAEKVESLRRLREAQCLLRDVADCGVAFEDERLKWVEVQIDRPTWDAVNAYRTPYPASTTEPPS